MTKNFSLKRKPLASAVAVQLLQGSLLTLSFCTLSANVKADPFFSEYIEGSSNNKALEIYNPGPGSFDLATNSCQIKMYFNGSSSAGLTHSFTSGTIAAGSVYVLANPSANSAISGVADGTTSSSSWFNGDDAVELVCNGSTKDIIGQIGTDPGSQWGTGLTSTQDNTLRRKSTITAGDTNGGDAFDPSIEWDGFDQDTFDGLGSHTGGSSSTPTLSIDDVTQTEGDNGTTTFTFTVNLSAPAPAGGVSFDIATADGTATTADSDYVANSLTGQTIAAGSSSKTFNVTVNGDTLFEPNETFFVNVSNVTDATIADGQGQGTIQNDDSGCGHSNTKISEIQGTGTTTPLTGQTVAIEGIVVGDFQGTNTNSLRGFFVQEEDADADGNPATSEGIFVFDGTNGNPDVNVGDKVFVVGTAGEFNNITQLSGLSYVEVCGTNQTLPTLTPVDLPVPGVPNGDLNAATAAVDNYFEPFESMLVTFPDKLKVSEYFQLDRFGEIVLSQGGRIPTFTSIRNPSPTGFINHQIKLLKRQIVLDDGTDTQNYYSTNNLPLPYPTSGLSTSNRFRGGDTIKNLSGILQLRFGAWRVRPVEELFDYTFAPANPRKANPPKVGGNLKVASFNVLNYFTTIDTTSTSSGPCGPSGTQDCRGADSAAELQRQTDKAAAALCGMDADIIGLMEIENNASASLQALADAANTLCGAGLSFINTGTIGGDAIKVGLLYKTATVSPAGTTAVLDTVAFVNGGDSSERNRPALAQSFTANGETFTVVVNHLKSKGSACETPDAGDGQGNCNQVRTNAANELVTWLGTNPTGLVVADPDYLIIGDLNSYAKEDPIKAIEAAGYTNLVKKFGGKKAYSYVFDGQTGYLDHALASASLTPQVTGTKDWHINADEPPVFDYNDDVLDTSEASFEKKTSAGPLYAADQYRTSDHDPVIIGLQLSGNVNTIDGDSGKNTLTGTAGKDRITGFSGSDTLTGHGDSDEFVYTSLVDGIDTIIDFQVDSDLIDLSALLSAIGYEGNDPLNDGIIQFAQSGSNTVVYIDADGSTGPARRRLMIIVQNVSSAALNDAANFIF